MPQGRYTLADLEQPPSAVRPPPMGRFTLADLDQGPELLSAGSATPKPHSYEEMLAAEDRLRAGETPATRRMTPPVRVPETRYGPGTALDMAGNPVVVPPQATPPPKVPLPRGLTPQGYTHPESVRVTPAPSDIELPVSGRPKRVPVSELVAPDPMTLRMSDAALETLKQDREGGFYATPYNDSGGLAIGYGFRRWKGKPVTKDLKITQAEADAEARRLVDEEYGAAVRNALKVPVSQHQFDALVSVAYNSTAAAVNLARRLNAGETLTEQDFKASGTVKGKPHPGLQSRRGEEYAQFAGQRGQPPVATVPPQSLGPTVDPYGYGVPAPLPSTDVSIESKPREYAFKSPLIYGLEQIGQGLREALALVDPRRFIGHAGYAPSTQPSRDEALAAASDVMEGVAKTVGPPALALGAIMALPATLWTVTASYLAAKGTEQAAAFANASPELRRFLANVAGLTTAAGGASKVLAAAKAAGKPVAVAATAAARPLVVAGKLAGEPLATARPVPQAGTVAEAVAPIVRPAPRAPTEIIARGGQPVVEAPAPVGETLGELVRTVAAPEPPPIQTESAARAALARLNTLPRAKPGDSRTVPFKQAPPAFASALFRSKDETREPYVAEVPLDLIIATQPTVSEGKVRGKFKDAPLTVDSPHADLPQVMVHGDDFYEIDGMHRIVGAWARGETTIPALVYVADPVKLAALQQPVEPVPGLIKPKEEAPVRREPEPSPVLPASREAPKPPNLDESLQPIAAKPRLALQIGDNPNVREVQDFEEAGRLWDEMRDRAQTELGPGEAGVSALPQAHIVDVTTGEKVADVSYNGRIWDAKTGKEIERIDKRGYGKKSTVEPQGQYTSADVTPLAIESEAPLPAPTKKPVTPQLPPSEASPEGKSLTRTVYDALTREAWPETKNAGEFRKIVAQRMGIDEKTLVEDIDALNDAAEAAIAKAFEPSDDLAESIVRARQTEALMPRAHRTLEKTKLQQFSTPLPIAVIAAHAADVRAGDVVLEPTAGTGNLLAPLKDRSDVTLQAVELGQRRADLLEAQGYTVHRGDYLFKLPDTIQQPTVIISNPPWGKYTTGKYGKGVALGFTPVDVAERFVAKMVRDLADGGRLVAVMPTTMLNAPEFKKWLRSNGTIRAIIQSPPGAYDTRATTVDSVLLVWDKTKKGAEDLKALQVVVTKDWQEYAGAVREVPKRESVPTATERPAERRPSEVARPAPERRPEHVPERPRSELAEPRRDVAVGTERPAVVVGPSVERAAVQERKPEERAPAKPTGEFAAVVDHTADERRAAAGSRQFAPYVRRTALRGVGHPKLIVEARQLAGVPYPDITLKPGDAIRTALVEKRVSVEQAEQALAALQANIDGHHGYLAADNVGVGKSREIALVILELMERAKADGRQLRLIVTTKSSDNIRDLIDNELYYVARGRTRDGRDLMNEAAEKVVPKPLDFEIVKTQDWPDAKREGQEYKPLPKHPRAIYVTDFYNLSAFRQALVDIEPHGIVGDEAHRFKNVEGAAAGGAWQNLHATIMRGVDRAQQVFTYFTATPAQTVYDYQYLYGLRLWPIDGFADWVNLVTGQANEEKAKALAEATERGAKDMNALVKAAGSEVVGGDAEDVAKTDKPSKYGPKAGSDVFASKLTPAEAEQIPREWKMQGRFSARDLWREGQEFTIHEAKLPAQHAKKYDQFVELAQDIAEKAYQFGLLDKSGKSSRFGVTGQLQFAAKRVQMQPALEEAIMLAKQKVAEGYQVVLSVINVTEMDPEKGNIAAAIQKINTRVKDVDPDDPDGGIVDQGEIPEALVAQAELLERAKALGKFDDPVDMVSDAFGADKVAFIIGTSGAQRQVAMREFQQGKRPVAFLSQAGSTGFNLDHRVWTDGGARGRRVFIDVQYEWSATESIQRYGRVGRSASLTQPVIMPLTFGNASEKKFLATIANRMSALGALSKGGADTTGAAGLEEFEIFGPEANAAARKAYEDLSRSEKRQFAVVKSVYRSPNRSSEDPFEPSDVAPAGTTVRDAQLALLFVPLETSNKFWQSFVTARESFRALMGHQTQSRTDAFTGEILRQTQLKPDLILTEVKNQKGNRFGILSGIITPRMPTLRDFLYHEDVEGNRTFSRRYVTFTAGDEIVSGLQIPWRAVKKTAEVFGHELSGEKLDTPAKVLAALKANENLELKQETDRGTRWIIGLRKDGKIRITGPTMAERALLLNNGAAYAPVGNFWFTTEEKLPQFLERFPVYHAPAKAPSRGGGGGTYSTGTYLQVPAKSASSIQQIQPLEFPELVELAREIQQTPSVMRAFRKAEAFGQFRYGKGIAVVTGLFKKGNEQQLAKTLAHEIGHLIDYLPHKTLKRGNILGRLFTLRGFLKHTFTTPAGHTIQRDDIRKELQDFSDWWRPWTRTNATQAEINYRTSSRELYADALSGLLTNPGELEARAPIFYREFFGALNAKPDVAVAYFELQEVLAGTREELIARRRARLRDGFRDGTMKALDLQRRKEARRKEERKDIGVRLRQLVVDRDAPLVDLVKEIERKTGLPMPPDENFLYAMREMNYVGGRQAAFLKEHVQPIADRLFDAGIMWEGDFGEALFNSRVIAGDRSELANPHGLQPSAAQELQDSLEQTLGPEKWKLVEQSMRELRTIAKDLAEEAHDVGLITDEMFKTIQENEAYAPFRVVEYMEEHVSWKIAHQKGTLKAIANPADGFVLKMLSTIRAIERNAAVREVVEGIKKHMPGEVEKAKTRWTGKGHEPLEPQDSTLGLVTVYEKGRKVGYYVDQYIAESLNRASIGHNRAVMTVLNLFTGAPIFRPLFTTFNPGFQAFNIRRDYRRFRRNMPELTRRKILSLYIKALPVARQRGFPTRRPESGSRQAAGAQRLMELQKAKILGASYNDLTVGADTPPEQYLETVFAQYGLREIENVPKHWTSRVPVLGQIKAFADLIRKVGDVIETLPKAAAADYLRGGKAIADLTPAQRDFIRRAVGSPDFLAGGTMTAATNKLFLYSNAAAQGYRTDWEIAKQHLRRAPTGAGGSTPPIDLQQRPLGAGPSKMRRSAYWWRLSSMVILPKILMRLALLGAFGEVVRRILQRGSSEYDRTNYTIIPLGVDDENGVVMRLPDDEGNRAIGAIVWKLLGAASGDKDVVSTLQQVLSFMGGQLPSLTPGLTSIQAISTYAAGGNPLDPFRGRFVLTDEEQRARGWPAFKKFVGWEFQELGGGILWKFYAGEDKPKAKTPTQVVLDLPILSNIVGRFIKSTAYGETERLRETLTEAQAGEARRRRSERDQVSDAVRTYLALPKAEQTAAKERAMAFNLVGKPQAGETMTEWRDRRDRLTKRFSLALLRTVGDPVIDTLLSATSNDQKQAILLKAGEDLKPEEFTQLLETAMREKIISPRLRFEIVMARRGTPVGAAGAAR